MVPQGLLGAEGFPARAPEFDFHHLLQTNRETNSSPIVKDGLYRLPPNIGSLPATGTALILPKSFRPEWVSAAITDAHSNFGISVRPMRHAWLKRAE